MDIYIVRHGQTNYNDKKIVQGWLNSELNESGIRQAKNVADKLEGVLFDTIYSSDLNRAYNTAKIIAENLPNLNINVAIGVGGTFDVMSETVSRAPEIYQKLNLEWLFRYFQNPKKSYKLGVLPKFFIKVLKYKNKNGK